jgi:hypothetical protein
MFRRNIPSPSSVSDFTKQESSGSSRHAGILAEDGGGMFLRNTGELLLDYMVSYPRRSFPLEPRLWEPVIRQLQVVCNAAAAV